MTQREWYAGLAMQGILASGNQVTEDAHDVADVIAEMAFEIADKMIEHGGE